MPSPWSSDVTHPIARRQLLRWASCAPALALAACGSGASADPIDKAMARLRRLAVVKAPPQPGDWLASHPEPGQTYRQFRSLIKTPAIQNYSTLRLVPIGPLSESHERVLRVVDDFLRAFFGLSLANEPAVEIESLPESAMRIQLFPEETLQLLTTHLLNDVLMKRRQPQDAAVLGITGVDLWPGDGWNFVFGQASLKERVGVWSMARNGDPDESDDERRRCTLRTVMTATHETGHMFGIRHCTAYECGMNGSNNSEERDRQPLEFCPECQAKLWWTLGLDPVKRSELLEQAAVRHGLPRTAGLFARQTKALKT
jgi:archaemetzincin